MSGRRHSFPVASSVITLRIAASSAHSLNTISAPHRRYRPQWRSHYKAQNFRFWHNEQLAMTASEPSRSQLSIYDLEEKYLFLPVEPRIIQPGGTFLINRCPETRMTLAQRRY